jgi:hypothetical protein
MAQPGIPTHREAEQRRRELVQGAGLPEPNEVRSECASDEVVLTWRDPKLVVVVDLDEREPSDVLFPPGSLADSVRLMAS